MLARKRALRDDGDALQSVPAVPETTLLHRVRNMWQFANLSQWIYLFGKAVKIDDRLGVEELEAACLDPDSPVLVEVGLALLKCVSSHRGLTPELFDEYTRRQYLAKAPHRNPFGTGEIPTPFRSFDVSVKLRILQQLTQWIMMNPDRIRDKMADHRDIDQAQWRIEPYGWDSKDRTYYVLDDNRIYRMTEPAPIVPKKKNTLKAKAARRASKRRRQSSTNESTSDHNPGDLGVEAETDCLGEDEYDRLGGMKWECVAVTLDEVRQFLDTLRKTRDENEKILRDQLEEHLVPILEKQEESKKRRVAQHERELLTLEKMANAKRSSRIATRIEQQRQAEKMREEEKKKIAEETAVQKERMHRQRLEEERDLRLMSREQRLREREARRIKHQETLAQLSQEEHTSDSHSGRALVRQRARSIKKNREALESLEDEDGDWIFDCVCGVYGHVDDGTHSIACDRCNVWQHSKCVNISQKEADRNDFHFICNSCSRQEEATAKPSGRPGVIKLRVNNSQSQSPTGSLSMTPQHIDGKDSAHGLITSSSIVVELPSNSNSTAANDESATSTSADGHFNLIPQQKTDDSLDSGPRTGTEPVLNNDGSMLLSSPHPTLSPPEQSPVKSRAYSSIFGHSRYPQQAELGLTPQSLESRAELAGRTPVNMSSSPTGSNVVGGSTPSSHTTGTVNGLAILPGNGIPDHSMTGKGSLPMKHSPLSRRIHPPTGAFPLVLPPATALQPSFPQPILTPPTKHLEKAQKP